MGRGRVFWGGEFLVGGLVAVGPSWGWGWGWLGGFGVGFHGVVSGDGLVAVNFYLKLSGSLI